jgi:hypothetical protein
MMDASKAMSKQYIDPENMFKNLSCYIVFDNVQLIFSTMWGQGTSTQIYIDSNLWKPDLAISYGEIKAWQANNKQ